MNDRIAFARSLRKRMTPEEVKLWVRLKTWRHKGCHFRRQAPIDGYVLDFLCKAHKLIVEVDGSQHGEERGLAHDERRDAHFRAKGYRITRLWNADINRDPTLPPTRFGPYFKAKIPSHIRPPHPITAAP